MKLLLWIWALGFTVVFPVPALFVWTFVLLLRGFARRERKRREAARPRVATVEEVARYFGVPEDRIHELPRATERFRVIKGGKVG